ncbi:chaperonin 10-like protein [Jimgerdemannia flammicorona]|uniref:Chaperonin 10-like protein n=1 Tax=Jimgerdemannia flammicorona TaxID=994334 RepID=A0A433CZ41_9FUNG|nr:chaperonin 10-like protein [Jimgerdemannia flammicorona]
MSTELTNLSAVLYAAYDLRMEKREIPELKTGELAIRTHSNIVQNFGTIACARSTEVQINVRATCICGSDLHYYKDGRLGPRTLSKDKPMILGHESAGIVTKIGEGVKNLKIGM